MYCSRYFNEPSETLQLVFHWHEDFNQYTVCLEKFHTCGCLFWYSFLRFLLNKSRVIHLFYLLVYGILWSRSLTFQRCLFTDCSFICLFRVILVILFLWCFRQNLLKKKCSSRYFIFYEPDDGKVPFSETFSLLKSLTIKFMRKTECKSTLFTINKVPHFEY